MQMSNLNLENLLYNYYDEYDSHIYVPEKITNTINNFSNVESMRVNRSFESLIKGIIIAILTLLGLSGSLVIARKYIIRTLPEYNSGKGIETAINHGYISILNGNNEYSEKVVIDSIEQDSNSYIKINDFFMDNQNISSTFELSLDTNINKHISFNQIKTIFINDLIVTDEEKNILYCANEDTFYNYCKDIGLDCSFEESNEKYYNSGLNSFTVNKYEPNKLEFVYNIYIDSLNRNYPKSKKIYYSFSSIYLLKHGEIRLAELKGDWNLEVDVPEKMYNRNNISYKVITCPDNITVTEASLSDTGFEFACNIIGIDLENDDIKYNQYVEKFEKNEITEEELKKAERAKKNREMIPIEVNYFKDIFDKYGETVEDCTNIKNENSEIFLIGGNPGRKQNYNFLDNRIYEFRDTFELTKYDATKKLVLTIVMYNNDLIKEKYIIELEKN